jgi:hypothetical protein
MKAPVFLALLVTLCAGFTLAAPAGHLEGYVPVVANAPGDFGSSWTTDLWVYRQSATLVHLWFNPSGQDNTARQSLVLTLSQPVTYVPEVVGTLFGMTGTKGSLHYLADGQVIVVSRTWTPGPSGGTYGQILGGIPVALASPAGAGPAGSLRMLVNQADGFRANVGLVNVSGEEVTVTVEVATADGQPAPGSSTLAVPLLPYDMRQVDDLLGGLPAGERRGLIVRASVSEGDGAILAYLSEVDNTTNSGSYQEAFRFGF